MSSSSVAGLITAASTFLGKRVPAAPSFGSARLFHEPSAVRKCSTPSGGARSPDAYPVREPSGYVDMRFSRFSFSRMYPSVRIPWIVRLRYQFVQTSPR